MATSIQTSAHKDVLRSLGILVDDSHLGKVAEWRAIYENNGEGNFEPVVSVDKNSNTSITVSGNTIGSVERRKKATYNAHVHVCEKWAALMFNEQTKLQVSETVAEGAATAELDFLKRHYQQAEVWKMIEGYMPEMFGMGTIALVSEYSSDFGIVHKWHSVENIFPIAREVCHGRIRSVVFASEFDWTDGKTYTLYNVHEEQRKKRISATGKSKLRRLPSNESTYRVRNIVISNEGNGSAPIPAEQFGLKGEFTSQAKLFSIFRPFKRKIGGFPDYFGVPIYYDAIDLLTLINNIFDFLGIDLDASGRLLLMDKDIFNYGPDGRAIVAQWVRRLIISTQALDSGKGGELKSNLITEYNPELRLEAIANALQNALDRLSDMVGLGPDAFKVERGNIPTATQVKAENQEKYSNLKKHVSVNMPDFEAFNRAVLTLALENERVKVNPANTIEYFFQDGVLPDDDALKAIALQEGRDGFRSVKSYLEEFRGLSGKELEEELALLQEGSDQDDLIARLRQDNASSPPKQDESEDEE